MISDIESESVRVPYDMTNDKNGFVAAVGSIVLVNYESRYREARVIRIKSKDIVEVVFMDDESEAGRDIPRNELTLYEKSV